MSGIAGIIRFDGGPIEPGLVERMTGAMSYRGPDGIHHWRKGSVALGHCMLRTTPESIEETQPLANEDESLVLVMDGWLSNWEELRRELLACGAKLRTRADAELVLRAYEQWGRDCLSHIDGDFAIVIWDSRRHQAFCARDRIGNKPFLFHWSRGCFAFASEMQAVLTLPWVPQVVNEGMIADYISDEWNSFVETIWVGIMRLPGASQMVVDGSGTNSTCYWVPRLDVPEPYTCDEDYFEYYRELLKDCVRRHSRSHVPVAYEVSGGLDSSAVFCMAEMLRRSKALPAPAINGYTVSYADYTRADEVHYARAVGKHLGLEIREIAPSIRDPSWLREQVRKYRDFPGFPASSVSSDLYSRAVEGGSRTVVTGLGGDHFLSGPHTYYAEEIGQGRWPNAYRCFKADMMACGARQTIRWLFWGGVVPLLSEPIKQLLRPLVSRKSINAKEEFGWLSKSMKGVLSVRRQNSKLPYHDMQVHRRGQRHLLIAMYYPFDAVARELWERMCASHGIELRHPFLSARFIEFAFVTPERLRSQGGVGKIIHRQALKEILPKDLLLRTAKADFIGPTQAAMRGLERQFTSVVASEHPAWLDTQGMKKLYQSYIDSPEEGWQSWVLGGIWGCHLAVSRMTDDSSHPNIEG